MKKVSILLAVVCALAGSRVVGQDFDTTVESYRGVANQLIKSGRKGNDSYLKLQELCDDIGSRLSGSQSLDQAIEWAQQSMKEDGHENVRAEKVMVRKWERGRRKLPHDFTT